MDFAVFHTRPILASTLAAVLLWIIYIIGLGIYRVFLHPLSKYPGPRLAGLTYWYECYWELVKNGTFTFQISYLHDEYGPIIRVNPDELHIRDSDYFEEFYAKSGRHDKYARMAYHQGIPEGGFKTPEDHLHRRRRAAMNPMFSRKVIIDFQPVVREKIGRLCNRILQYAATETVLPLHLAYTAFATDVITQYAFARSYDHLDSPEFTDNVYYPFHSICEAGMITLQFDWILPFVQSLPDWFVLKMQPGLYNVIKLQRDLEKQIQDIIHDNNEAYKHVNHATIFHELLNSTLPAYDKRPERLIQEAQTITGGGILTTSWTLTVATFHITANPAIHSKLRAELDRALPDAALERIDWLKLESLPYLTACIQEAIRLSYGLSGRNPRVLNNDITYKGWSIKARTPVSMTLVHLNHDEDVFPDSHVYKPERWMADGNGVAKTKKGVPLEKYFAAFGKGSRQCQGMNLAYAELYMCLAAVVRKFEFELYETDESDVKMAHDQFVVRTKLDSKGVRMKVRVVTT